MPLTRRAGGWSRGKIKSPRERRPGCYLNKCLSSFFRYFGGTTIKIMNQRFIGETPPFTHPNFEIDGLDVRLDCSTFK